ncbi:hypothetical protein FF36_05982 [Frankia torreyi]|uniref:Uncharacterized protein n=1 Tax=Frankia torreyi TaxID=1856 RepID=A0A0D8B8N6_9ACTN|nr:hypothetical protein FF36_05982 [Frankia torreyi]
MALVAALAAADPAGRVRHELDVAACRVDVALIGEHELTGYEINLRRLAGQAAAYSAVLDRVTLVATGHHLDHAAARVPAWWGLTRAEDADGHVRLVCVRPTGINPAVDPAELVRLLWREEARTLLWQRGRRRGTSRLRRGELQDAVAADYPLDELRAAVRRMLRARPAAWTAASVAVG